MDDKMLKRESKEARKETEDEGGEKERRQNGWQGWK